jgi:hypothetical protein
MGSGLKFFVDYQLKRSGQSKREETKKVVTITGTHGRRRVFVSFKNKARE